MKIHVRYATEQDLKHLQPINSSAKETLRKFYHRIDSVPQMDDCPTALIVAEIDCQLVGRCEYRINNKELYFLSIGVLDTHRGLGVLKKIFEFLESIAKQEHCNKISCETIEETGNRKIFEKLGMDLVSRQKSKKYIAPDEAPVHEVLMTKILD